MRHVDYKIDKIKTQELHTGRVTKFLCL